MKVKFIFKHMFEYISDQSIDIRIRMMYFLQYAALLACLLGTTFMILLKQPFAAMIPNHILFVMSFLSLYLSHSKKKYDLATIFLIIGSANIALPWMFFAAGGNESGMHAWMIFGVVVTCMMTNGKIRFLMTSITILEDIACICIGYLWPETVKPLVGENSVFIDRLQSFAIACVCLTVILSIYITTYDNQRKKLEEKSAELKTMMMTDALTGVFNRHAYYEEVSEYKSGSKSADLVLVAMDVNGLKKINDQMGHAAGDDYIRTAAQVISQAMGQYGHIFRTGGDEFMALLHCSAEEARKFETRLSECIAGLNNEWSDKMAIATGIVSWAEIYDVDFTEIEKIADKRMYENKAAYYRRNGIDRRR